MATKRKPAKRHSTKDTAAFNRHVQGNAIKLNNILKKHIKKPTTALVNSLISTANTLARRT